MRKKLAPIVIIVVASMTLLAGCSGGGGTTASKGTLGDILSRGKLIVGTGSGNPPFHFLDTSGKLVGMDIDIAKLIAKGLFGDENKIEFVQQTSDSRIPNIVTGKIDITCQFMTVTALRAQQVAFTTPYYREGVGLLLKKGGKYKDYAALLEAGSKVKVSILQNVTAADYVHAALPKAQVLQFAETTLIYAAVDAGRADAAASDQSAIAWLVAQSPKQYADSGYGWMPQNYSCALKQGDQVWLNFVNQVINEAMTGVDFDTYAASFKKWFGVKIPSPHIGLPR